MQYGTWWLYRGYNVYLDSAALLKGEFVGASSLEGVGRDCFHDDTGTNTQSRIDNSQVNESVAKLL